MSRSNQTINLIVTMAVLTWGVFWQARANPIRAGTEQHLQNQFTNPESGFAELPVLGYQIGSELTPVSNDENQVVIPPLSEVDEKPVMMWYPELFWIPFLLLILLSCVLLFRRRSHNFNA